jgi:glycopeptide antibiotics resistance protein
VAIGIGLEMIQFIVGLVWKSEFRVIDINDAILNCSGVVIGKLVINY